MNIDERAKIEEMQKDAGFHFRALRGILHRLENMDVIYEDTLIRILHKVTEVQSEFDMLSCE